MLKKKPFFYLQPLVNFGVQKKEREEKISQLMKEKGPIWKLDSNGNDIPVNGIKNGFKEVPKIKDVIGESLKYVGPYKKLDNKKQVVALIDDVIFSFLYFAIDLELVLYSPYACCYFVFQFAGSMYKLRQMLYGLCRFWLSSD